MLQYCDKVTSVCTRSKGTILGKVPNVVRLHVTVETEKVHEQEHFSCSYHFAHLGHLEPREVVE